MDSFGKPITDYPEILKTISATMFKNSLSIKSLVTHKMQQRNSYTCGRWSLYFLLASNNLNSVLPELFYFKLYAMEWNCQNWFAKSQQITEMQML